MIEQEPYFVNMSRLGYAIVETRWMTASGYEEVVAWFIFKKDATAYLTQVVPNRRERRNRYRVRRLKGPQFMRFNDRRLAIGLSG